MYSATPGLGQKDQPKQKGRHDILTPAIVIGGIVIVILFLVAVIASGQTSQTPIYNGLLQSDLNAAGYKILSANLSDYAGANMTWNVATNKFDATGGGGGAVTSVFTRTGAVVAATNDYTFAQIGSKPTTLSGYGITDAQPLDADLTSIAALTTTSFGRGFLPLADAAAARTYIGAGTGGGTPGGANTQVQYNNSSAFGGITGATTNGTTLTLASPIITGTVTTGGALFGVTAGNFNMNNSAAQNYFQLNNTSGTSAHSELTFLSSGAAHFQVGNDSPSNGTKDFYIYDTTAGTTRLYLKPAELDIPTGTVIGWGTSGAENITGIDTGIAKNAAGIVEINNGTAGTFRDLFLRGIGIAGVINWSSDTGLARNAAGVVEVNNGTAGSYRDLKADEVNAVTGFQVNSLAPNNYELTGNGTDFIAKASDIPNGSSAQATGFASNTYLAGSVITVNAGDWKVGSTYRCMFDMAKTTAGTAAPVITIYVGTNGTTADTAVQTITFAVATGVADTGIFDVLVNFRAIGASATVASVGRCVHNLAATGLTSTGASGSGTVSNSTSSTFNSTAATKIGIAFNGGSSYVGTNNIVQASYSQP